MTLSDDDLMRREDAARMLAVSVRFFDTLAARAGLSPVFVGCRPRFYRRDVKRLITTQKP